jgi:23S rRNA (adenine2503-C2)-methyltransferase
MSNLNSQKVVKEASGALVLKALWPSRDQTVKVRLQAEGVGDLETVLIPSPRRTTVCVSSQVGCVRGCVFCATGKMGFARNLDAEHIVEQIDIAMAIAKERTLPPVRNIVFMGMGEPLDNWSNVRAALSVLLDQRGRCFAPKYVTLSTVGPSPEKILRLRDWPARIAWSLHSAIDEVRKALIPTARYSVVELRDALYLGMGNRRAPLYVEMTLIDGKNDDLHSAQMATELFQGAPVEVRFNLIPVNPSDPAESLAESHRAPPNERVVEFRDRLRERGYFASIRATRGDDQSAACGQLATLKSTS